MDPEVHKIINSLRHTVKSVAAILVLASLPCLAQVPNWTGPYEPCSNSADLKKTGHLSLGVRYDTSDPGIIREFHEAFAFWAKVLDADFHDEKSTSCAIGIVDGTETILSDRLMVARAQFPDRSNFEGLIAIDPRAGTYLTYAEAVAVWAHEIGHLLGLRHNPAPRSLMYYIDVNPGSTLDDYDLRALATLHTLRSTSLARSTRWVSR